MPSQSIVAVGHENVRATHGSTLELTADEWLTPAGDCIVGVEAAPAPVDFEESVIAAARSADATVRLELRAGDHRATVSGRGDPSLTFEDARSMVCRTSTYVDDRTLMVGADRAAADLDRELVSALQAGTDLTATFSVTP